MKYFKVKRYYHLSFYCGILLLFIAFSAAGQSGGFKKLYAGATGMSFVDIVYDNGKLFTTGQFLTDTAPNGAYNGLLYMELDTNGNELHTDVFFYPNDAVVSEYGNSITRLSNGDIALVSQLLADTSGILHIYRDGQLLVNKKLSPPSKNTTLGSILEINDGLLIAGHFQNHQLGYETVLYKTDKLGGKIWEKHYGHPWPISSFSEPLSIDQNMILFPNATITGSIPGSYLDIYYQTRFLFLDSLGNIKSTWESNYNKETGASSRVVRLPNHNWLYATAEFVPLASNDYGVKPKIVCRDSNFNLVWERLLSWDVQPTNRVIDLQPTPDGNFLLAGRWDGYRHVHVQKFTPDGTKIWDSEDTCFNCDYELGGVTMLPNGVTFAAGYFFDDQESKSYGVLLKISPDGCWMTECGGVGSQENHVLPECEVFPNPVADWLTIRKPFGEYIELFDLDGRKLISERVQSDSHSIDMTALPSGSYLLTMNGKTRRYSYMVVKQ